VLRRSTRQTREARASLLAPASRLRPVTACAPSREISRARDRLPVTQPLCDQQWPAVSMPRMREASDTGNHTWVGSLLIAASATAYSTAGFFTRLIDLDIWTVLFWRGLFAGLFIAGYVIWENGRETAAAVRAIGARGLWIAFLLDFCDHLFPQRPPADKLLPKSRLSTPRARSSPKTDRGACVSASPPRGL